MPSDMKYEYYVTQITGPPYDGLHVIVPKSWIPAYDSDDEMGVVKYPSTPLVGLEQWVVDKEEYCEDWSNFAGFVKFGDDSYEKVIEYIERLTPNTDEEPPVKRKKNEVQKPENEYNNVQLKQLHIVSHKDDMSTKIQENSQIYENNQETDVTIQSCEEVSINHSNTPVPQKIDEPNMETILMSSNNNLEELISLFSDITLGKARSETLLDSLNRNLLEFEEKYDIFDALRTNYGDICSLIKKIIEYFIVNKNKLDNTLNTSKGDVADGEVNKFKQTEQKEETETENFSCTIKENQQKEDILLHDLIDTTSDVTPKKETTKRKGNQLERKDVIGDKSEKPLGVLENFINKQKEQEETNNQMEEEADQLHEVIEIDNDNTADIENNPGQLKHPNVKNPLECHENNSKRVDNNTRSTQMYPKWKEGLVELVKDSGVYVNEQKLNFITLISSNSISLAESLVLEVFSLDAIDKCKICLGEKNIDGIQGLDAHALGILMRFVKQYSFEHNYMHSESGIFNAIQKKILYTKNKIKFKRTKYVENRRAADNTAQFFLKSLC